MSCPSNAAQHWRTALFGTVAAGVLFMGYGRTARAGPDACATTGNTATCQGDHSDGITNQGATPDFSSPPVTVLNVNTLIEDPGNPGSGNAIAPGTGVDGIHFTSVGSVTIISNTGPYDIFVNGAGADGIFARSQGGADVTVDSTGDITSVFGGGLGIMALSDGAGTVDVTSAGTIQTNSAGIYGRSDTGRVSISNFGDITSSDSLGIRATNINVGDVIVTSVGTIDAWNVGIDAIGGTGSVTIDSTGDVTSRDSVGIRARSYGLTSGDITVRTSGRIDAVEQGIFARSSTGRVTIHNSADIISHENLGIHVHSTDGAIVVESTGDITSLDNGAVYARTNGAKDVSVITSGHIISEDIGIFARSDGGAVRVENNADITSLRLLGIRARSYGTGSQGVTVINTGDIVSYSTAIEGRSFDGDVTIVNTGDLVSHNFAGIGGRTYGPGSGNISITNRASVEALNIGIGAYSTDGIISIDSTGDITSLTNDAIRVGTSAGSTVTLQGGRVVGAIDGVEFTGAGPSTLNNFADLSAAAFAVRGGGGSETIRNHGLISGSVDLGGGANAFYNLASGTFRSGTTVALGGGNTLTNAGVLAPGLTTGAILTTGLTTGNLVQSGVGTFAVDLDLAGGTADRLNVLSGTAALAGAVGVSVTTLPVTLAQTFTIVNAAGGVTDNGLNLLASPALNTTLSFPNPNDVVLGISIDFSTSGLNINQTAIATHLDGVLGAGGGGLGDVLLALLNTHGLEAYKDTLDQLSPEVYNATKVAALHASLDFSNALLSCKVNGAGESTVVREGQCLWAGARARFLDSERTRENIGFDEDSGQFSAGVQVALDPAWRLGFGMSYQTSALDTQTGAESDGDLVLGGVALKYNAGPLLLAATAMGGRGWYDTTRFLSFGGVTATAEGEHEVNVLAGGLHASYVLGSAGFYSKPLVDVGVTQLDLDGRREIGAGGAGLVVRGGDDTVVTVAPALEIGTQWHWANGTLVRPFVRAGVTWFSDTDVTLDASFLGSPAGVAPFRIANGLDELRADFGVGLDLVNGEDAALRLGYDGHAGETAEGHNFTIKGSVRF